MNRCEFDRFEKIEAQLEGVYSELSVLSKRAPSDAVNPFKLQFINRLLAAGGEILGSAYRPFDDFEQFDVDDVPQNSDVVFILSQYLECFEKLRSDNVVMRHGDWCWEIDAGRAKRAGESEERQYVRTRPPKRMRK